MELWKSDPEKYKALYFDGREELRTSNRGQEYGKVVATALENASETGDLLTDAAMLILPKYDTADKEIFAEFKTKYGWLKLIGKPDTLDSSTQAFREYKTGKHPWTQKKAQKHPQMIYYAIVIWLATKVKNMDAWLDWIETESTVVDSVPVVSPTGRVESFRVTFTPLQYLEVMNDMAEVAHEIEVAWASHVTNPEIINF